MSAVRRDERGQVIVLAAVMIPVFLLMAAFVVDVGNWYTHKRQLQNRADAAAYAAGVAYAKNWKACVQDDDAGLKASTAQEIADTARQYAGDPDATDYAGDTLPTPLENTEITRQNKLDVAINSTSYDDNTDYSDDYDGVPGTNAGDPCLNHPAGGDDISPAGGQWVDVKVKERDLGSLFGGFGLPLSRNGARARVEIRPALSGNRFLPLAIPNNVITRVQVRYYNGCTNAEIVSARHDLAPLPSADQAGFASLGGGVLWGLPATPGDLSVGDPNRGFDLDVPAYDPAQCSSPYLPVKVEVRLASRDEVNLNDTCANLAASKFADCFSDVSRIRVWPDGNPSAHPLIKDLHLTGGCATRADAYFGPYDGPLPSGSRTCTIGATVGVDFGARYPDSTAFKVQVNGVNLVAPGANPNGVWTTNGTPITISTAKSGNNPETGINPITVKVFWTPPTGGEKSYQEVAQQSYIGTSETAGALDLVRTSQTSFASGLPGPAFDNVRAGGSSIAVFPTVGIRSVLKTGILTTLRTGSAQGSQLVQCDPDVSSGQEFTLFQVGCKPYYAKNQFVNGDWWNTTTKTCPSSTDWYSISPPPLPKYVNSASNPWRCVLQAPGGSVGQVGDWMAAATDNCAPGAIQNNKCQTFKTPATGANCANYDGKPGDPNGWVQNGGDSNDPRVIKVFIVPYQALKNVTGASAEIPLLGGASFYVMNWKGQNPSGAEDDPCPDPDFDGVAYSPPGQGTITGVFVENVTLESGPVDETAVCVVGQLEECRAVLVR